MPDQEKLTVAFDILDIENNLLVPSPDGDFLLIGNGDSNAGTIILPKLTSFISKKDYDNCSSLYDCENPDAGDLRVLSPAVADKLPGGWLLRERGRLEVVPGEIRIDGPEAAEGFPVSGHEYQKNIKDPIVVEHDLVDDILKLNPQGKGELVLKRDPHIQDIRAYNLVPRLTNFSGKQGFLKYFSIYYEHYYNCKHPGSGDVWIINPAIVNKTHGGWTLYRKGLLEVRNQSEPPLPEGPVIPVVSDNESRTVEESSDRSLAGDGAAGQIPNISDARTADVPSKLSLQRVVVVCLAVIVTFFSFYGAVTLVRNLLSSITPGANRNEQTPTPTPLNRTAPAGMVYIPGGEFLMGNDGGDDDEKPAHKVTVTPFYIDVHEVTCGEYEKFLKANSEHKTPLGWVNRTPPPGAARKPVTGVNWDDANAYAQWAKKRLPTEEEWEFAARGTDGRRYPWGNEWKKEAANAATTAHGHLAEVGEHSEGASPFGVFDMVGNAWEWTATEWKGYPGGPIPPDASNQSRVIRGGYWGSSIPRATTTFRRGWDARGAKKGYENTGFRCAADVNAQATKK